jgi:hypothetical protein
MNFFPFHIRQVGRRRPNEADSDIDDAHTESDEDDEWAGDEVSVALREGAGRWLDVGYWGFWNPLIVFKRRCCCVLMGSVGVLWAVAGGGERHGRDAGGGVAGGG